MKWSRIYLVVLATILTGWARADGIRLEGFQYPYAEHVFRFATQREQLEMVYMDVAAAGAEKGVVVLLHGKNFSGSYFGQTAAALSKAGYRVIIPDQIGFGKSSKPRHYSFTFQQLARNTESLLERLGVGKVHVLGHSMGGMIATRFTLMYPEKVTSLTLLNPIGLEDWQQLGVPPTPLEELYKQELAKTSAKIRAYQLESYYDGKWKDEYTPWVDQLASFSKSEAYPLMAWDQALTSEMIFCQPVVHEFPNIKVPTLLIIGQRDRTAIGKGAAPAELREKLGNYPELGRAAHRAITGSELVELDGLGHLPHIEAFDRFITPYLAFLNARAQ